ncbi:MAG: hypothetical protein ACE5OZ_15795 [Candidatus Heimdallarchaeota archaeon]
MASLDLFIHLLAIIGLLLMTGFCFSIYLKHRIPQFLILGFALFPFAIVALILQGFDDPFPAEIGLYAGVVALLLVIGFALSIFWPKFLEIQWFLPYSISVHFLAISAIIVRHETSYAFSEALFILPLLLAVILAMGGVTWKLHQLGADELTLFLGSFLIAALIAGLFWFFNPLLGYIGAVIAAIAGLIVAGRTTTPESIASLYREYFLLPGSKYDVDIPTREELQIAVMVFGPKGPELTLEIGEMFNRDSESEKHKFVHFFFAMLRPLIKDSDSFFELFGPLRPFGFSQKHSLACVTLLPSKISGDQRLGGKTITIFALFYPRKKESPEIINLLRMSLREYCQDLETLEEVSDESLKVFLGSIISRLHRDLNSSSR